VTRTRDDVRADTRLAIDAVRHGLALARAGEGADAITSKGGRDLVTATDVAVEDAIRRIVGEGSPFPVVGEERGGDVPADGSPYWLVDPICGTRNFASGIPLYAVNLALVEDGRISAAAVGDGSTGEVLFAQRGAGAWATIDGASRPLTTTAESRTIVVESGHVTGALRAHAARFVGGVTREDRWDLRNLGSSLSLPYVAGGRVAAYVLFAAPTLHIGAGAMLVVEAGGTISEIGGGPWSVASDSLIAAADPALQRDLVELARAAVPELA
jgi:myo-inositol-1(or 4)-monophosphatase